MQRKLLTVLVSAVSLTAVTAAHATPPGFGGRPESTRTTADNEPRPNDFWWPDGVDLTELRKNRYTANPHGEDFDYAAEFAKLDLAEVKADVADVLTTSQDWWPADYGSYAGLFIRLAWHSAGTYRGGDGRGGSDGGQLRFEPLNSWPDNGNLDKARRLLWPVKQKYGASLSWSDLMVLAGNVALEKSGFKTYGFAGGRADAWEPELVYWGAERKFLTSDKRYKDGKLEEPLSASELGLIYVNPEGPEGNPEILKSAEQIRTTFGRMGMNDEETVALIVGGHTLGKAHGARKAAECVGPEPAAEGVEKQGLGWENKCGTGVGKDATTSGLEGAWTATPVDWSNNYIENLYAFEWQQTKSPSGATQWEPVNADEAKFVPDAFEEGKFHAPVMFTTDLALRYDPEYGRVTKKWLENPGMMDDAFARAWFKLTHRDMGPNNRYVGPESPKEALIWQDPVPSADYAAINDSDVAALKASVLATGLSNSELVRAAWASASTFRDTDYRGGANGARIRLAPQNGWEANSPAELSKVLSALETVKSDFNAKANGGRKVSMADLIVLAGNAAIERAAEQAGHSVTVPFTPGRTDATAEMTDAEGMELLRPAADGFRNYHSDRARLSPAKMLVDKADTLSLTVPEMTALVGGLRALDANVSGVKHGVFTDQPGALTNDFFVNLLDMSTQWAPVEGEEGVFEGRDRASGDVKWTATEVDLVFGSNSELRAVAETYAFDGAEKTFAKDFVAAWTKVMELDRFDVK
ncbi:MAG: catalase/peroxidase HPI [Pseudomonadota bacterium]|nr:catalase/peroxidase HPI [Pseudomonadota bacterium]